MIVKRILFVALLLMPFLLISQENKGSAKSSDDTTEFVANGHHFGFFAGTSAGLGLSYRYFKNKFGVQVAALPLFSDDGTFFSVGGEVMTSILRVNRINLYTYLAYHYMYEYSEYETWYQNEEHINHNSIAGIGAGLELIAGEKISFNWQLGLNYYYFSADDWGPRPGIGFGIYYKFQSLKIG